MDEDKACDRDEDEDINILPCTSVAVMSAVFFSSGHLCVWFACACVRACTSAKMNCPRSCVRAHACMRTCERYGLGFRIDGLGFRCANDLSRIISISSTLPLMHARWNAFRSSSCSTTLGE